MYVASYIGMLLKFKREITFLQTSAAILRRQCMELDKVGETMEESGVQKKEENNAAKDNYRGRADDQKIGDWADDFDDTFYDRWCSWLVERLEPMVASAETPMYINVPAKTVLFFVKLCVGKHKKETKQIAFDHLVGLEAPRAEMKEVVYFAAFTRKPWATCADTNWCLTIGSLKTSLAHALAREAEASFLPVAGEDLLRDEKGIGKLNSIFNEARESAPSIIFIDGVEAVKAVKKLTEQMDKCVSDGAVVLVVATAEKLHRVDDKLMNYLPTMIELKKPNLQTRQDMANVIIQKQETEVPEGEKETFVKCIASEMDGFVWKDISLVCFESRMRAMRRGAGVPMTLEDVREYIKVFKRNRSLREEKGCVFEDVKFTNVAGLEKLQLDLEEIVKFFTHGESAETKKSERKARAQVTPTETDGVVITEVDMGDTSGLT
ncbi:ATPase, AAA-type, core, P-loop containing nucleoside triphosphate hydrolase [Tanacetum coccineum]